MKFNDPKFKKLFCENRHEAFILLKLFVCNQFETVVVCQELIHVYAYVLVV